MFSQIKQTNDALFLTNPKEIYNKIVEASGVGDYNSHIYRFNKNYSEKVRVNFTRISVLLMGAV